MRGSARTSTGRFLHRGGSLCLRGTFCRVLPHHPPLPAPTNQQQSKEEEKSSCPPALQVMAVLMPEPAAGGETPQDLTGQHLDHLREGRIHGLHLEPPWEHSCSTYLTNPGAKWDKHRGWSCHRDHQPTRSSTRRWWYLGLRGDSDICVTWRKYIYAEEAPQFSILMCLVFFYPVLMFIYLTPW